MIGPVLYICSFLPHASVSTVAGFCLSRLRTLEIPDDWDLERDDPMTKLDLISVYTDPLCNWGRGDDLLEMAVDWIKKGNWQNQPFGCSFES